MTPPAARSSVAGGVAVTGALGWVETRLAMERIWPVFTSMTTAIPTERLRGLDRLGQGLLRFVLELRIERQSSTPLASSARHRDR